MSASLLNENQARHLSSVLALLLDEISQLEGDLPREPWGESARAQVREIESLVHALLRQLGLRLRPAASSRRRVQAYANAWLARLYDLHAGNLLGYGPVSQGLAEQLDPALDQIARSFEQLARVAGEREGR